MKNKILILLFILFYFVSYGQKISVPSGVVLNVSDNANVILSDGMNMEINSVNTGFNGFVKFTGNSEQTVSGSEPIVFENMYVDNNGLTLENNLSVNSILNMQNGIINIQDNNFTVGSDADITGNFSENCMIVKNNSGVFQRNIAGNGVYFFPVGNISTGNEYSPAEVELLNGTYSNADIRISVENSKFSENNSTNNYLNRYWEITQNGISDPEYHIDLTYLTSDISGNENQIYGALYNNNEWLLLNPVSNNAISADVNQLGVFTGGEQSAFSDVELISDRDIIISGTEDGIILNSQSGIHISEIDVFNVLGQEIYTQREIQSGIIHFNSPVQTGIFFVRLFTNKGSVTKKVLIY